MSFLKCGVTGGVVSKKQKRKLLIFNNLRFILEVGGGRKFINLLMFIEMLFISQFIDYKQLIVKLNLSR